jgi:hypothetical protein
MKTFVLLTFFVTIVGCQKQHSCVCKSNYNSQDTIIDKVKTTKIGAKGYKKWCLEQQNSKISNCYVKM